MKTVKMLLLQPEVTPGVFGPIPMWLDPEDPRRAAEQLNEHYAHGGGWQPFEGFKELPDGSIVYPDAEPLRPLAAISMRDEIVVMYPYSWVMIRQKDGTFEICRMD